MKHASYRYAVAWVAENDSGGDHDALIASEVQHLITACLVAETWLHFGGRLEVRDGRLVLSKELRKRR